MKFSGKGKVKPFPWRGMFFSEHGRLQFESRSGAKRSGVIQEAWSARKLNIPWNGNGFYLNFSRKRNKETIFSSNVWFLDHVVGVDSDSEAKNSSPQGVQGGP